MAILKLDHVVKRFGDFTAVNDLSFSVPEGGIFGFLGGNGAGKTTSLRMALDIIRPTSGKIEILGRAPGRDNASQIGFLPEERGLYRGMSARSAIAYLARLKGTPAGKAFKAADRLLTDHGLGKVKRKKIKTLSKGMAQKVQVLGAIAHEPDLIIFDEPFSGLDPVNQRGLEETIRAQAAAGRTILFSTHVMEHAERLCDRILLIAQGKAAFEGTVRDALALAPSLAVLETDGDYDISPVLAPLGFQWTEELGEHGNRRWRVRLENGHGARQLPQACVEAGAPLSLFEPARASLHEAFVALVGDKAAITAAE